MFQQETMYSRHLCVLMKSTLWAGRTTTRSVASEDAKQHVSLFLFIVYYYIECVTSGCVQ